MRSPARLGRVAGRPQQSGEVDEIAGAPGSDRGRTLVVTAVGQHLDPQLVADPSRVRSSSAPVAEEDSRPASPLRFLTRWLPPTSVSRFAAQETQSGSQLAPVRVLDPLPRTISANRPQNDQARSAAGTVPAGPRPQPTAMCHDSQAAATLRPGRFHVPSQHQAQSSNKGDSAHSSGASAAPSPLRPAAGAVFRGRSDHRVLPSKRAPGAGWPAFSRLADERRAVRSRPASPVGHPVRARQQPAVRHREPAVEDQRCNAPEPLANLPGCSCTIVLTRRMVSLSEWPRACAALVRRTHPGTNRVQRWRAPERARCRVTSRRNAAR